MTGNLACTGDDCPDREGLLFFYSTVTIESNFLKCNSLDSGGPETAVPVRMYESVDTGRHPMPSINSTVII